MPNAINTLRETLLSHLDPEFECKDALAALADVEALLQAAEHILYPNGRDLNDEWHGSELLAAVRRVKGDT